MGMEAEPLDPDARLLLRSPSKSLGGLENFSGIGGGPGRGGAAIHSQLRGN
jgi:hypothetical protein